MSDEIIRVLQRGKSKLWKPINHGKIKAYLKKYQRPGVSHHFTGKVQTKSKGLSLHLKFEEPKKERDRRWRRNMKIAKQQYIPTRIQHSITNLKAIAKKVGD